MILDGDAIRKQVRQAEKPAAVAAYDDPIHIRLALWVIAEQLYEIRQLIGISLEKEK